MFLTKRLKTILVIMNKLRKSHEELRNNDHKVLLKRLPELCNSMSFEDQGRMKSLA